MDPIYYLYNDEKILYPIDLVMGPVALAVILTIGYLYCKFSIKDKHHSKIYLAGLSFKLAMSFLFALVYQYYYGHGDTYNYYAGARILIDHFWQHPNEVIEIFTTKYVNHSASTERVTDLHGFFGSPNSVIVIKTAALFGAIFAKSYLAMSFCFGAFAFQGTWMIAKAFTKARPNTDLFYVFCAFFPTLVFWTSGVMKDTILLGALGFMFYAFMKLFHFGTKNFVWFVVLIVFSFYAFSVKEYAVILFYASVPIFILGKMTYKLKYGMGKYFLKPTIYLAFLAFAGIAYFLIARYLPKFTPEILLAKIITTGLYIESTTGAGGSSYSLGTLDLMNPLSAVRLMPYSIFTTFFRPYIWEAREAFVLITAFESFLNLILVGFLIFKVGIVRIIRAILAEPILLFSLVFVLLFAAMTGFSLNFGALVRYKTPLLPFFYCLIIWLFTTKGFFISNRAPNPSGIE
ncbi:MAG: hypothetical protein KTR13_03760 [Saprospiraceae bacterium]|nr:hypothetical protein [Saprospiraceae bacterium]